MLKSDNFHHRRSGPRRSSFSSHQGEKKDLLFRSCVSVSRMKRIHWMLIIVCATYVLSFSTLLISHACHEAPNPQPSEVIPPFSRTGGTVRELALRERIEGAGNMNMNIAEEYDISAMTGEAERQSDKKGVASDPTENPRHAVMIIAVAPNSIDRISAIWSQLECFANDYEKIIIACKEGNELAKTALANLSDEVARNMPDVAARLEIQFSPDHDMWDTGLWCSSLTNGILEKGPDGTYVGGTSSHNFQNFLLINDSVMAVEKSNELMEVLHAKNLALASFNFWDANKYADYTPFIKEPVSEPFWVESYARAFSLEGIQIFADKLCSRKPIVWREDCPDMMKWEHLGTKRRLKRCLVRYTEMSVASFYPKKQAHGIYPGKVPEHMVMPSGDEEWVQKPTWTGHYVFWSEILRDKMNFPVVKISDPMFLAYAKDQRPGDFATCTNKMDQSVLNEPFGETVDKREVDANFWLGEAIEVDRNDGGESKSKTKSAEIHTLEMVVAYCKEDLNWMRNDILDKVTNSGITNVKMTILSKCGNEKNVPNFFDHDLVSRLNVAPLPNVGGIDHSYAHFINDYVSHTTMEDAMSSVILFIKDTPRNQENFQFSLHRGYRDVDEMLKIAAGGKFICGTKTNCDISTYHIPDVLYQYSISNPTDEDFNIHGYADLSDFHHRALNWTFPDRWMIPVCYGGTFAVPASRLITLSHQTEEKRVMEQLEGVLSRKGKGGMIAEEYFTERTWAGLFSIPLKKPQVRIIHQISRHIGRMNRQNPVFGAFIAKESQCRFQTTNT